MPFGLTMLVTVSLLLICSLTVYNSLWLLMAFLYRWWESAVMQPYSSRAGSIILLHMAVSPSLMSIRRQINSEFDFLLCRPR